MLCRFDLVLLCVGLIQSACDDESGDFAWESWVMTAGRLQMARAARKWSHSTEQLGWKPGLVRLAGKVRFNPMVSHTTVLYAARDEYLKVAAVNTAARSMHLRALFVLEVRSAEWHRSFRTRTLQHYCGAEWKVEEAEEVLESTGLAVIKIATLRSRKDPGLTSCT